MIWVDSEPTGLRGWDQLNRNVKTGRNCSMRFIHLVPAAFLGLAGCAVAPDAPPQVTTTTYNPATTTTTVSPAPGYAAPTSTSTTYVTPAPGYMAPATTSTTYVTPGPAYPGPAYATPTTTTTVVHSP
jgi:hypothetical protein